jgi:hypothetical protein
MVVVVEQAAAEKPTSGSPSGTSGSASWLYATKNTEYHVHDGVCTAVRDRASGRYVADHPALNRRLTGSMRLTLRDTRLHVREPRLGEGLFFILEEGFVLTGAIVTIEPAVCARPRAGLEAVATT